MSGIARFTANNIANGILRAVVFRPYQGVFFPYNYRTVLRYTRKCNFIRPRKKKNLRNSQTLNITCISVTPISAKSGKRGKYGYKFVYAQWQSIVFTALVFAITQYISVDLSCTECHPSRTNYNTAKFNLRP